MQNQTILALIIVGLFVITACTAGIATERPPSAINPEYERFFIGTRGTIARFEEFPQRIYYYTGEDAYNVFDIGVEVENDGASFTRGAVFLSGYNPNLIQFEEIPLAGNQFGACGINIGSLGWGNLGGLFSCDGIAIGGSEWGDWFAHLDTLGASWWNPDKFNFGFDAAGMEGDVMAWTLNFGLSTMDMDYLRHGRMMIGMFSGINFARVLGREYLLAGDTYEFPGGELAYFNYHGHINPLAWPPGLDEMKQSFLLTNCYMYTTYAAPLVCIDPNPNSDQRKVCFPKSLSWSNSQGAPVAVTSIEQENTPHQAVFRINIANVGPGEVYGLGQLEKCSPYISDRVRAEDKNIVYIGYVGIDGRQLECSHKGELRLQDGRGTITCSYPYEYAQAGLGLQSGYETPLVVELWYGYSEVEQRDMYIKRVS